MSGVQKSPRGHQRRAALSEAMSGGLVQAATYSLQHESVGRYSTTLPPMFFRNTGVEPGDRGAVYVDIDNECIVIDYGGE